MNDHAHLSNARDKLLFTPGLLTTSLGVKQANHRLCDHGMIIYPGKLTSDLDISNTAVNELWLR